MMGSSAATKSLCASLQMQIVSLLTSISLASAITASARIVVGIGFNPTYGVKMPTFLVAGRYRAIYS